MPQRSVSRISPLRLRDSTLRLPGIARETRGIDVRCVRLNAEYPPTRRRDSRYSCVRRPRITRRQKSPAGEAGLTQGRDSRYSSHRGDGGGRGGRRGTALEAPPQLGPHFLQAARLRLVQETVGGHGGVHQIAAQGRARVVDQLAELSHLRDQGPKLRPQRPVARELGDVEGRREYLRVGLRHGQRLLDKGARTVAHFEQAALLLNAQIDEERQLGADGGEGIGNGLHVGSRERGGYEVVFGHRYVWTGGLKSRRQSR